MAFAQSGKVVARRSGHPPGNGVEGGGKGKVCAGLQAVESKMGNACGETVLDPPPPDGSQGTAASYLHLLRDHPDRRRRLKLLSKSAVRGWWQECSMPDEYGQDSRPDESQSQGRVEAIADGKAAYGQVLAVVGDLVRTHSAVLVAKRRQMIYRDDYGRLIDDEWTSELDYFCENLLVPALAQPSVLEIVALAQLGMVLDKKHSAAMEAYGTVDPYFDALLRAHIEALVEAHDASSPAAHVDVDDLTADGYEEHCAQELRNAGWTVRVCGGSGDQGVDLVADRGGIRAVFQCKLYGQPVGNGAVQEVFTGRTFHSANIAAVVSCAEFTRSARAAAEQTGVLLLHHSQLAQFSCERVVPPSCTAPDQTGGT